jgi:hypothetical protein
MKFIGSFVIGSVVFLFQGQDSFHAAALRETATIAYPQGHSETVKLRPTDRLEGAFGAARVERKGRTTDIEVEIRSMKPASLFGGDYNTYVLWIVSQDRQMVNLGELVLEGTRSSLHSTTNLAAFGILITAEPHYLVSAPSAFVVLENRPPGKSSSRIQYPVLEGVYNFERATLNNVNQAKGKVHTEVKQAFTALRLAQREAAAVLANDELLLARRALDKTLQLLQQGTERSEIEAQARETIRLAVAAQHIAQDRAFSALESRRKDREEEVTRPEGAIRARFPKADVERGL